MGLFDKVSKAAGNLGKSALSSAANIGSTAAVAVQEQQELAMFKAEVNVINQELDSSYAQIGRKYVEYVLDSGDMPGIDVSDILKLIDPKISKKQELEIKIVELEKQIKSKNILRAKQAVEEEFLAEKIKLDKALAMDVLSQDEYDIKIAIAKKRVDNYEAIRKVEQQADMGLITKEEKEQKIKAFTE